MSLNKTSFIELAIKNNVLQFGNFITKAGRESPYFFNLGAFDNGVSIKSLGQFYANRILETNIKFDMLYGPAYKGITLVTSIAISLAEQGVNIPYCFNRKEAKDHGEGGNIVGAPINGNVLIIDDVISAGTSINESNKLIKNNGGYPVGVFVAIDRQEKGPHGLTATAEVSSNLELPVYSIINLMDIISYLNQSNIYEDELTKIKVFQKKYGIT
ncbi:orotate phosphoribosyltransferase [Methylophilaceae bacterium]|jgi:orotate phosphoribosyltransferase|nr:orotate phosphoribosyltransferase [Methylophilaceae bacterium]MDC1173650.1 orotate phosphoribosyltransferase [Methylophilaceae bacterium]|tara:strand:+ start:162 stop:803 length:642 start_codon:yes stop_codon:yes gene_type:complete